MSAAQDTRSVFERMVAIIDELPAIDKSQRNEQQGFMFRGHDDVLNALNPLLAKHGVLCVPNVVDRATAERTTSRGSVMFVVNLHVAFTFYGANGDSFAGSTWGEGTDMGDKATSKAMTMAFKSMLNQAFAISNKENADPDSETVEHSAPGTGAHKDSGATHPAGSAAGSGAATSGDAAAPPPSNDGGWTHTFGKHKGKTVAQVEEEDPGWHDWFLENGKKEDVKVRIREFRTLGEFAGVAGGGFVDDDIPFRATVDGLGN